MNDPFKINDVRVYHVPVFDRRGGNYQVTRVSIMVGDNGPFVQDFGPGQPYADTQEAIDQWKRATVSKVMAVTAP